jgi:hypothetical protein
VFFRKILTVIVVALPLIAGFSQQKESKSRIGSKVIDDSTKNIYGPKTSRWITEKDLFENKTYYQPIDTSITNYHRWTQVQRHNNFYKDLGFVGTALSSIYPVLPTTIGVSPGYTAYEPYYTSQEVKYFDTKSPYARMYLIWGGLGRAATRVEFSRNINPRWNFGFNYRPLLVDKQVQRKGKGDRQTISHYLDGYMTYRTENDKYSFLVNYRRIRHRVNENGGVNVTKPPDSVYSSLFLKNVTPKLASASSIEQRNNFHYFHQFKINKGLQVYHKGDWGKQYNLYKDDLAQKSGFYDHYEKGLGKDSVKIKDSVKFAYLQNEFGVKGNAKNIFYNFYYKIRSYEFSYKYLSPDSIALKPKARENYVGAKISYSFDSLSSATGWVEYLLDGNYRVEGELTTKWIDASAKRILSKPGFVQNAYRGSFDYWNNKFTNKQIDQAFAFLKATLGPLSISPGFTYTAYQNYIYYVERNGLPAVDQRVFPEQSSGKQILFSPEVRMDFRFFKNFHFRPQTIYSKFLRNDDRALRVPELFVNSQLAFENLLFKKNIQVQIGLDVHWHSAYAALAYDPIIQQFYIQNDVVTPAFPLVDVFLNGKIKTGKFFVKYHNFVQLFTKSGYLPTPDYPGQRNVLDFGFELLLFD